MANWWQDLITQAFNPPVEPGEDIGTPFHTPVTALESGSVTAVSSGGFGERIDISTGPSTSYYVQHLDEVAPGIHVGSQITAGEQLGLSGGQLAGGEHPNSPLNSTGPHIEVGETVAGRPVNPAQFVAAGPQASLAGAEANSASSTGGGFDPLGWIQNLIIGAANLTGTQAQVGPAARTASTDVGAAAAAAGDPFGYAGQAAGYAAGETAAAVTAGVISGGAGALSGIYSSSAGPWLKANIIPLVVAVLIILVVLGAGNKTETQTQVVPLPVPV